MTKRDEYTEYINNHIKNVRKAYEIMKDELLSTFKCNPEILERNIIKHDLSKFSDEEFEAYRQYFYPEEGEKPDKELFNEAWKHHYLNNPHHPEFWVKKDGVAIKMSNIAIAEMFCDWAGMSLNFKNTVEGWYKAHEARSPFNFHPETRKLVEDNISITRLINNEIGK